MFKVILACASLLLLNGCGTEAKNFCPGGVCKPELDRQRREQCAPGNGSFHEVTVRLSNAVPNNIAVDVNGERRFDDCNSPVQKAPFVSVQRASGNRLVVRVEHAGAFPVLPTAVSLNIINLQACVARAVPAPIFTANDIPLTFVKEGGTNVCPARDAARTTIQQ